MHVAREDEVLMVTISRAWFNDSYTMAFSQSNSWSCNDNKDQYYLRASTWKYSMNVQINLKI